MTNIIFKVRKVFQINYNKLIALSNLKSDLYVLLF